MVHLADFVGVVDDGPQIGEWHSVPVVGIDGTEFLKVGLPRHGRSAYASRTNDLAGERIPAPALMRKNAELTLVYDRAVASPIRNPERKLVMCLCRQSGRVSECGYMTAVCNGSRSMDRPSHCLIKNVTGCGRCLT
jgi:hypothetical protein